MPIYVWECKECNKHTEVSRNISEYDKAPDEGCSHCKSTEVFKIIEPLKKEQVSLVHGGIAPWHAESYIGKTVTGR